MPDPVLTDDPISTFAAWMAEAERSEPNDPNAMSVASATPDGFPSVRILLLKEVDARGFVFYTNFDSRKGSELRANAAAALCFHWKTLQRQVRVEGTVVPVSDSEADAYFASRERMSQLGAWASLQSRPLPERATLEARVAEMEARFAGRDVPRPPHWSGFRLAPERVEFWIGRPSRLHDRFLFSRDGGRWRRERLFP